MSTWQVSIDCKAEGTVQHSGAQRSSQCSSQSCARGTKMVFLSQMMFCTLISHRAPGFHVPDLTSCSSMIRSGWTVCWSDKSQCSMLETDLLVRNSKLKVRETEWSKENHLKGKATVITCFITFTYQLYSCTFTFNYWWLCYWHLL